MRLEEESETGRSSLMGLRGTISDAVSSINLAPLNNELDSTSCNEFHPPNANMQPRLPVTRIDGKVGYNDFPRIQEQSIPRMLGNAYD